jgi:hypothetical protein
MVSHITARTDSEGVTEECAGLNIRTSEGRNNRSLKKNYIMRSFIICSPQYYQDDHIKEDEMAGYVARMEREKNASKILTKDLE